METGKRQKPKPTNTVIKTKPQKSSNEVSLCLQNPYVKVAGRLRQFSSEWERLTNDRYVLDAVKHYRIEFSSIPEQSHVPKEIQVTGKEITVMESELTKLQDKGVIVESKHEKGEYISSVFLRPKKDGKFRMILNLKSLNESVCKQHFKMESLQCAIDLLKPNCYMGAIDISDAYYSIPVDESQQKYLKFTFKGKLLQFTCMPQGLSCAPRCFTKVMKPVLASLRRKGYVNVGYIDDIYLQGDTYEECANNIADTAALVSSLGFIIHPEKSIINPVQKIKFLGFTLDSVEMIVEPTQEKKIKLKLACNALLNKSAVTAQELAQLIGTMVSNFPAVKYGPLHYRSLERDKSIALRNNKGNYLAKLKLSQKSITDISWWINNIDCAFKEAGHGNPDILITTDASRMGWGAVLNGQSIGGQWSIPETRFHINYLEMLAVFLALKSFCRDRNKKHIRVQSDNTTTVAYLNEMGGMVSDLCDALSREIWEWCIGRELWLSAAYLPGKDNTEADTASRHFNENIEWMLRKDIFLDIEQCWGPFEIDLFASRLNAQLPCYASWKPDPGASYVDAFTMSWHNLKFYAFPPFSLILKCLKKIEEEKAEGILVIPNWSTQPWYPKVMQLITDYPRLLPIKDNLIQNPVKTELVHPLWTRLHLMVCKLSGQLSKNREFLERQQTLFSSPGDQERPSSTGHTSGNGQFIAVKGTLIPLIPL